MERFFDIGESRSLPWARRPEATRLLATLKNPNRGFSNVVIGEPHRAFYGNQFGLTMPLFTHYGVRLWVPEVGGPIDPDNKAHDLVMSVFGGMSKGERNRVKVRVRTAMTTQTLVQGRYLGGRPPYGYKIQDLGLHPNPQKAADGKQLHGLTPDPVTAPIVARIFADFLNGHGVYAIAEALNEEGILCPSAYDRTRNPHRSGRAWLKSAVRLILGNPRYTGRQVWNKQRTDEVLLDVNDVALGHVQVGRWNPKEKWVISKDIVHEPIVSEDVFNEAQEVLMHRAEYGLADKKPVRTKHAYVFKSLVYCAICERRMQGMKVRETTYYRCRYPAEYARVTRVDHPKNLIMREDAIIEPVDRWLARIFSPAELDRTIEIIAANQEPQPPAPIQRKFDTSRHDAKLAQYRAALDAGADPVLVAGWIADTQRERELLQKPVPVPTATHKITRLTEDEIRAVITELGDVTAAIREADPQDKYKVYRSLKLRLTYALETQTVRAEIDLGEHRWGIDRVRGDLNPHAQHTR